MKSLGQIGNILKGFDLYVPPKKQTRQIVEYTDLHEWKRQSLLVGKILEDSYLFVGKKILFHS